MLFTCSDRRTGERGSAAKRATRQERIRYKRRFCNIVVGVRLIARGANPWYARAITLKYNSAPNRAEVPLPNGEGKIVHGVARRAATDPPVGAALALADSHTEVSRPWTSISRLATKLT